MSEVAGRGDSRGNDGLTDAERAESAARWAEGVGKPFTPDDVAALRAARLDVAGATEFPCARAERGEAHEPHDWTWHGRVVVADHTCPGVKAPAREQSP